MSAKRASDKRLLVVRNLELHNAYVAEMAAEKARAAEQAAEEKADGESGAQQKVVPRAAKQLPKSSSPEVLEFEVQAESSAADALNYGPYVLDRWDALPVMDGTRRSFVLRLKHYLGETSAAASPTRAGFYHGISLQEEICTVACVFLRRRIRLGALLRLKDKPIRVAPASRAFNKVLASGRIQLSGIQHGLRMLESLPEKFHEPFILACRMYEEAIAALDDKPDLAYLLLVSCLEVFVAKYSPSTTMADFSEDLREAVASHPDRSAREALEKRLCGDRLISRNFVIFTAAHITEEFWKASPNITPEQGRIQAEELPDILKRIYSQRSKTLHEAMPFPPNVLDAPESDAEIDRSTEVVVGDRRWTDKDMIPYVRFFERLVNFVLMEFLRRNSGASSKS
jgi:hypothetical protein